MTKKQAKRLRKPKRKTLLDVTRERLITRPRTLTLVEIASKIDVSESWLNRLIAGQIHEPGVNSIQRLYELLTGRELDY